MLPDLGGHGALTDLYARALVTTPPTERAQGGFIAEGYDHALDELRRRSRCAPLIGELVGGGEDVVVLVDGQVSSASRSCASLTHGAADATPPELGLA